MSSPFRNKTVSAAAQRLTSTLRRLAAGGGTRDRGEDRRAAPERPFLEVQYHPHNIRKGVRYLFLTRRQVGWIVLGSAVYLAFVGFSLTIAPTVIGNYLAIGEYEELVRQRLQEGDRLKAMVEGFADFAQKVKG